MAYPSAPLLEIHDLAFAHDAGDTPVLAEVELEVSEGELVLLCGPTGCGKTTLALCLNGLVPYATGGSLSGTIRVGDADPARTPTPFMAREVGLVFQDPEGQLCTLFLEDEVAFGPENLCIDSTVVADRVEQLLELIGLAHLRSGSVFELSGGQKQKVNVASVLAMEPRLLVLDMPTANLDPVGASDVFQVIRRLVTEQKRTCLVIENRLDDLAPLADRVIVMAPGGRIAYDGPPSQVFAHGEQLVDQLGVEIPQVVELALALKRLGVDLVGDDDLPLTVAETTERMERLFQIGALRVRDAMYEGAVPTGTVSPPIVKLEDVCFSYHGGREVLKGISFEMGRGELLAIIGNNGSGKTTLARHLVGLLRPQSGQIWVCGLDARGASIDELSDRVAYVFQYPDQQFVAQGQTVYDEIAFNLRMGGYDEEEIDARVEALMEGFQLTDRRDTSPFELSGGEMRTLSVVCMLSTNPELLILDEPTYGQDRHRIRALMNRLAKLRAEGTSVIMITHDMRLVAEYATSAVLLNDGELLFHGSPRALFGEAELLRRASLKQPPVCAVAGDLRARGVPLADDVISVAGFLSAVSAGGIRSPEAAEAA